MFSKLMEFINTSLEDGQSVYLNLMTCKGRESFYKQFGFEERPNENLGAGMTQWVCKKPI